MSRRPKITTCVIRALRVLNSCSTNVKMFDFKAASIDRVVWVWFWEWEKSSEQFLLTGDLWRVFASRSEILFSTSKINFPNDVFSSVVSLESSVSQWLRLLHVIFLISLPADNGIIRGPFEFGPSRCFTRSLTKKDGDKREKR